MPDGFKIDGDQVKKVADDVAALSSAIDEMKTYTTGPPAITKQQFGQVSGLSEQASAYLDKTTQLGESLAKASGFLRDYSVRLNKSVTLTKEQDAEATWNIKSKGEGL